MFCKNCGNKVGEDDKSCKSCGNLINHNDIQFVPFKNYIDDQKKCPKCGYLNSSDVVKCKNCEFSLNQIYIQPENKNVKNTKVNKKKNILLFVLFSIIYLLAPIILMTVLSVLDPSAQSPIVVVIAILLALEFMFFIEPLTCLTVKKLVNNTVCMKQELMILEIVLLVLSFLFFKNYPVVVMILTFARILTWFVTRSIFIKEKIKLKPKWIITFILALSFVFIVSNLYSPTKVNKYLYKAFGSTSNFTKDFQICLIEKYNRNFNGKDYTYFHKLTKKELASLTEIYIDQKFTNSDISKLKNVKKIYVSENVDLSSNMDFSKNTELEELIINSNTIKKIKLPNSISLFDYSGTLDNLDISKLNHLVEIQTKVNNLVINDFDQIKRMPKYTGLYFNTLIVNDQKLGLKNGFMSFRFFEKNINEIYLPNYTKVSDIKTENLKIKVMNSDKEKKIFEEIENMDKIYFYDNNDNLIWIFSAFIKGDDE